MDFELKEKEALRKLVDIIIDVRENASRAYEEDNCEKNRLRLCAANLVLDIVPCIFHNKKYCIADRYDEKIFDAALMVKLTNVLVDTRLTHEDWSFDKINRVISEITNEIFKEYLVSQ